MSASRVRAKDPGTHRRRGVVAVQVAVMLTAIVGFAALTIDVGAMFNAKAELQRTADAAALAAASKLASFDEGDPTELARAEAQLYAQRNGVFGRAHMSLEASDVEFGRAVFVPASGSYDFSPSSAAPDAVRVRVRLESGSPNGALSLFFARVLGFESADLRAEAIAMMVPRDIAIVADLSGSHKNDSELKSYRNTQINIHEVWADFPGGADEVGSGWAGDEFADPAQMAGPAWGFMRRLGWGTETIDAGYDPRSDPGLIKLAPNQDWSDPQLIGFLQAQGYIEAEIEAILSSEYDTHDRYPAWDDRTAVALGLARWNSGIPGGLWQQMGVDEDEAGNGNQWISGGELTWVEQFGERTINNSAFIWRDYIDNYMEGYYRYGNGYARSNLDKASRNFRYHFGAKTFTNYLIERRTSHGATPEFAGTPTQPMQAVKDAVSHLTQLLYDLDTDDRVSLEIYGRTARHEVDLTADYASVATHLSAMQAAHYDSWTNMGGGITRGIEELTSERARPNARKVMILLTDGNANVRPDGSLNEADGKAYAEQMAAQATDQGIRLFAVSVGSGADLELMDLIASMSEGEHFHAAGSIEAYSAQLEAIFAQLGGAHAVEIIR